MIRTVFFVFLFLVMTTSTWTVSGQSFCIDSNKVNPYYICNGSYDPQCGCDGKIYRNEQCALYKGGLYNYVSFYDGNCGSFDYEILPTISGEGRLVFGIFFKEKTSVYISIYDIYGHKKFEENLGFLTPPKFIDHEISLNGFFRGMYVFVVTVNGESKIKKFIKASDQ